MPTLLDHTGRPMMSEERQTKMFAAREEVGRLRRQITREIKARYDAAETTDLNERHWKNADYLDPHQSASSTIRRRLRSRSRYEVLENNPYLKGIILTLANDFVGTGPKLQITDKTIKDKQRRNIEQKFANWFCACKLRQKLWRMRLGKCTDGETYLVAFTNKNRRFRHKQEPVSLDFMQIETDRVQGPTILPAQAGATGGKDQYAEVDGVRFDEHEQPVAYHIWDHYPGSNLLFSNPTNAKWVNADYVIQWFRQDRPWLRGIPETAPSLPLCALLRRYTLAVVRAAEIAAMFTAVLKTMGPANATRWQDGDDDPFDVIPFDHGMMTTLPWGYELDQLKAEQPTTMYDTFVNALLREIVRPLLVPFNIAAGSSAESNMASAVLDAHIYKTGQGQERVHCEENVLDELLAHWFREAALIDGGGYLGIDRRKRQYGLLPDHCWRWDPIGLDHTDPTKVQNALKTAHDKGFLTDRDIQESRMNRSVEQWRDDLREDAKFREELKYLGMADSYPKAEPGVDPQAGQQDDTTPNDNGKSSSKKGKGK